jgi:rhodanese-related sulfurtransferase
MTINIISLTEIQRLRGLGKPLNIFDVRTPAEFDQVHVAGARLMPLDQLDPAAIAAARRDADEPVYVICQSGGRAGKACERLAEAGLAKVFSIEGGTSAWEKAGLPVVRGSSKVISLERQVRIGAGFLVVLGVVLAWTVHRGFLAIPAFVGSGLVFAGITDYCGMGMLLAKMPWNRKVSPKTV